MEFWNHGLWNQTRLHSNPLCFKYMYLIDAKTVFNIF